MTSISALIVACLIILCVVMMLSEVLRKPWTTIPLGEAGQVLCVKSDGSPKWEFPPCP